MLRDDHLVVEVRQRENRLRSGLLLGTVGVALTHVTAHAMLVIVVVGVGIACTGSEIHDFTGALA